LISPVEAAIGRDKDRLFLAAHREALQELLRREEQKQAVWQYRRPWCLARFGDSAVSWQGVDFRTNPGHSLTLHRSEPRMRLDVD
jgi:hypothetical protein